MSLKRRPILLALSIVLGTAPVLAWASTPFLNRDTLLPTAPVVAPGTTTHTYSENSAKAPTAAPLPENTQNLDKVVAVVNDNIITSMQLEQRVIAVRARLQTQDPNAMPPEDILRRQVLQQMILQDIELQIAHRAGIKVDKGTLDQAISNLAQANHLSSDQLRQALANQGQSWESFTNDLRDRILVDRLMQQEVENRVHIGPDEVKTFAQQLKEMGGVSFDLQQIFIPLPGNPTPDAVSAVRREAEQTRERVVAGERFSRLAAQVSSGHDALQGGRLGWVKAGELPPAVTQTLLQLKAGEISPVIPGPTGFHIFKLLDVKHAQPTVTEVKAAMIVLRAGNNLQLQEAAARAQDIQQALQSGTRFSELARKYSQEPRTAARGGEMGWVAPGQLPDSLERSLVTLQPGGVSSPIREGDAIYILHSQAQRQQPVKEKQIMAAARMQLYNRIVHERMDEWQRRIRDSAYVEILESDLRGNDA
ncbi:Chaperone surA [Acidithiobacillus ferrivorans SS3]|jgi:peptidyl-prolyl cis-trans isomerase SurA|uniref:Chaperone SurA n=1 Tax=Acidithiobacillus ferrivorans SS3 TaxID=743299 RepID=G0JT82_9PROT|nr:peptidylprolyl isomerase [Acidithiobacillus ferrivorans]AEM48988.1 Chaperone surA [Acidithiobacillus ferrivorans SS3]MBU2766419.1 SurA domain protein [Acidithiobacillus ferrivorans]OFA17617.1 SurA domain protein [Acidithiobacillus ferrivorans]